MKSLAFGKIGGCIVFVGGKRPYDDGEWEAYVKFIKGEFIPGSKPICLVHADSAGPTAEQRQIVNEVIGPVKKEVKAAVMTSSQIARGIVTAMSWMYPVYRAFSPSQVDEAIAFLGVAEPSVPAVKQLLADLKIEVQRA
jgi:hypothetical protein